MNLDWTEKGIRIDGEYLSHLDFADDIVLFGRSRKQITEMAKELENEAEKSGLKINAGKTLFMTMCGSVQSRAPISLKCGEVKYQENTIYLGRQINMKSDCSDEIARRCKAGWGVFHNFRSMLVSKSVEMKSKRKIMNTCILPAMTYGAESWALCKRDREKLGAQQRRMERAMVGITLSDRRTNQWLRGVTKITDVRILAAKMKAKWTVKLMSLEDSRWTKRVFNWTPNPYQRSRMTKRWTDELKEVYGSVFQALSLAKNDKREYLRRSMEHAQRMQV